MIHRMNDEIILTRNEKTLDERKCISMIEHPPRTVKGCIRTIQSKYERKEPVEWEYLATLAFLLQDDIKIGDTLEINGYKDNFFVVEVYRAKRFLHVQAVMNQRGASE